MKKQILRIGSALSKREQRAIYAGALVPNSIELPCEEPVLAPPPEGCFYRIIRPCTYVLVCSDIMIQ